MVNYFESGKKLNELLLKENDLMTIILTDQQAMREAVRQKDWGTVEDKTYKIAMLSEEFSALEDERGHLLASMSVDTDAVADIYKCVQMCPQELRGFILENYRLLRQKLSVSKIENESLNQYINVTRNFIQNIFDTVVPQAKSTVYSRSGQIVKNQPESLVLNQLF